MVETQSCFVCILQELIQAALVHEFPCLTSACRAPTAWAGTSVSLRSTTAPNSGVKNPNNSGVVSNEDELFYFRNK